MPDWIGQQIGNYRLVRLLGQGSFGSVYLAEHLHLQTQAAIKLLHQQVDAYEREVFLQEARTIASLKHAHILRVLDFGFEQNMPYLVMEHAPNGTLRQRHPRGSLVPMTMIRTYVQQIAQALQYAHDRELIHRDIKPENVLFDEHEQTVLGDFGIALKGSRKLTEKDIAGTATYMAPELFEGKPRRASDQYALGIMVYEWSTGNPPFRGDFYGLAGQHLTSPVPELSHVPKEVATVIYKALEKVPEDRFPSVTAFANALEQASQKMQVEEGRNKTVAQQVHEQKNKPMMVQSKRIPSAVSSAHAMTKTPPRPRYAFVYAVLSGLIAGSLGYVAFRFNASRLTVFMLLLFILFWAVICFLAGFITGKTALARKMGWITGIAAGLLPALLYAQAVISDPYTYMERHAASTLAAAPPVAESIIVYTLLAFSIAIPFTFCGIWLATRTHSYYRHGKPSREERPNAR